MPAGRNAFLDMLPLHSGHSGLRQPLGEVIPTKAEQLFLLDGSLLMLGQGTDVSQKIKPGPSWAHVIAGR